MAENGQQRAVKAVEQNVTFAEGVNLVKTQGGRVVEEQSVRIDARKTTGCRVDLSGPEPRIIVTGKRQVRMDNLADENEAGTSLAEALSKQTGRTYLAEPKAEEDSDFPDIRLIDAGSGERICVQIRHFDDVAVRQLGKDREFNLEVTPDALADAICASIAKKNRIDPRLAATSYLLLISPYPLPPVLHPVIRDAVAARGPEKKYLETWVASRREPAFRVQG